jgi:hypothetical protein
MTAERCPDCGALLGQRWSTAHAPKCPDAGARIGGDDPEPVTVDAVDDTDPASLVVFITASDRETGGSLTLEVVVFSLRQIEGASIVKQAAS